MESKIYVTGMTALMGFFQRLFVVFTVGTLFAYLFLRSDMRPVSPIPRTLLLSTTGTASAEVPSARHTFPHGDREEDQKRFEEMAKARAGALALGHNVGD